MTTTITLPVGATYYVYAEVRAVAVAEPLTVAARPFHAGLWAFELSGAVCLVLRSVCEGVNNG